MGCRPSDVDGLPVFPNLSVVDYTDCLIAACPAGGIEECLIPVARDWESTFSSWAQPPGKTEQQRSENAINAIRNAVDGSPKLRARRIKVFTQGSFRNRVTVRQDSDVDVGAMLYDYFLAQYPEGKVTADFGHHDVDYSFSQFKSELEETLVAHFGRDAVTRGNKTFSIRENTYRVEADVTPFFEFRQYWGNGTYRAGVALVPDNGSQIENFPERLLGYWPSTPLHYENGVSKNDATERRFKGIVRILKRLLIEMDEAGYNAAKSVPGYLLECMSWNVPDSAFNRSTWDARMQAVLLHLWSNTKADAQCKSWREVDNIKYLFHRSQRWTRASAHAFLNEAWSYVGVR